MCFRIGDSGAGERPAGQFGAVCAFDSEVQFMNKPITFYERACNFEWVRYNISTLIA